MGFLRVALTKDIRRLLRDPAAIAMSVLIPLVIGVLIKMASGGGGTPTAKLLVADHDQTVAGTVLMGMFGQGDLSDLVQAERVTEEEGRARMDKGEASGLLILPEEFTQRVLDREPVTLELITNPSERILPGILEEIFRTLVDAINGIQNILDSSAPGLVREVLAQKGTPPDAKVAELSVIVNGLVRKAEPYLMPPAIQLETQIEDGSSDDRTFGQIFFPSMFFLAIIFAAQNLSDDLWKERMSHTLHRSLVSPNRMSVFFAGKILAGTLVLFLVALAAMVVGKWIMGIPFQNVPLAVVWATFSGVFMLLVFTLLQILASSQRGGSMLSMGVTFPLVMAGGAFFPFEAMPVWLARVGKMTPNGWALARFKEIVDGVADPGLLLVTFAGLTAVGAVLYLTSLGRMARFVRG